MVNSNILIWNEKVGFVRINEGSGDNLSVEDMDAGYVDYVMLDFLEYNGMELVETQGVQIMLCEMYQEKFEDATEVVNCLIADGWIPDEEYYYLHR